MTANIEVGDTVKVEEWGSTELCTVVVVAETDSVGRYIVRDSVGRYYTAEGLVKVEPTPADLFLVIDKDGDVRDDYRTAAPAIMDALDRNRTDSIYVPYRVARYTFAEWVEA